MEELPVEDSLADKLAIEELVDLVTPDQVNDVQKLVEDAIGEATEVIIGNTRFQQMPAKQKIRDQIFKVIEDIWLRPTDFKINVAGTPGKEHWLSLEKALENAIWAASSNDRFWA